MIGNIFIVIATILGIWGWLKKDNTSKWLTTLAVSGILVVGAYDVYDRTISGQEIKRLSEMAEPPVLSLINLNTEVTADGYSTIISLNSSKNEPLGLIQFIAVLPKENASKIVDFWPEGGISSTGKDSKKISTDGRIAILTYQPISAIPVKIKLVTSGSTPVLLQGNYIKEPINIEIK